MQFARKRKACPVCNVNVFNLYRHLAAVHKLRGTAAKEQVQRMKTTGKHPLRWVCIS